VFFETTRDGNYEICWILAGGSAATNLTNNAAVDADVDAKPCP
jgi:hypothetical protein